MNKESKIYIAWHNGLVWSAIVRKFKSEWYTNLLLRTRKELDLVNQQDVYDFLENEKPDYIVLVAAKVWGIKANMNFPSEFLIENLQIQNNVIWWAHLAWIENLLFLGSSCIYPRWCNQPMKEEYLLDGKPEPTNEWYALAKIVWMKLCEKINTQYWKNYLSCMPTNIYGPWDNFDPETSHVIPWLMKRIYDAKQDNSEEVVIWWSWESRREFLYVEDLSDACLWLLDNYSGNDFLNVWTGIDISIKELAYELKKIIWYKGNLTFDTSKPDGMPKKLLDISRIEKAWWKHTINLSEWLNKTYDWYLNNKI